MIIMLMFSPLTLADSELSFTERKNHGVVRESLQLKDENSRRVRRCLTEGSKPLVLKTICPHHAYMYTVCVHLSRD